MYRSRICGDGGRSFDSHPGTAVENGRFAGFPSSIIATNYLAPAIWLTGNDGKKAVRFINELSTPRIGTTRRPLMVL